MFSSYYLFFGIYIPLKNKVNHSLSQWHLQILLKASLYNLCKLGAPDILSFFRISNLWQEAEGSRVIMMTTFTQNSTPLATRSLHQMTDRFLRFLIVSTATGTTVGHWGERPWPPVGQVSNDKCLVVESAREEMAAEDKWWITWPVGAEPWEGRHTTFD